MSNKWLQVAALLIGAAVLIVLGFVAGTLSTPPTASIADQPPSFADLQQADSETTEVATSAQAVGVADVQPIIRDNQPISPVAAPSMTLREQEQLLSDLYTRISPSVVSISVRAEGGDETFEEFSEGSGSGFVIDRQGHIITNNHVVDNATRIAVNFLDGTIVRAEVVGLDPDSDIAVLRVDLPAEQLSPVVFGDSDQLVIGQSTIAIGSPFGQRWTMTTGIISALDRTIFGLTNFSIGSVIQTDAAINPGNSGGPLLNLNGEVIGVNSQIISEARSNSGIGFAVPSNLVKRVATELITDGDVDYSYMGITGQEVSLDVMEQFDLPNDTRGAVVIDVVPNSPAADAGLNRATNNSIDIIVAIDGVEVTGMNSIIAYLGSNTRPGDTVTLTVLRNGERVDLPMTLSSRPEN